jgi:arylsulfatase A-like enzyme
MIHKNLILSLLLSAVVLYSCSDRQPNIIYILTDDIGIGKVSCYGMGPDLLHMPNIDKLAEEGVVFTDAYANPVCGPTRASLITGQHSGRCGHRYNSGNRKDLYDADWPPPDGTTIGEVAQKAGYKTASFGKLGAGTVVPYEELAVQGWDYSLGWPSHLESHHFFSPDIWENGEKVVIPGNNNDEVQAAFEGQSRKRVVKTGVYTEFFMTDKMIEFMRLNKKAPFFVFFGTQVAHGGGPGMSVPDLAGYENMDWTFEEKVYAASITHHDKSVGRILDALKELKIDKKTILIWTSDNGDENSYYGFTDTFEGNGIYRGKKRDLYEGGIRVPTIARWPGHIDPGTTNGLPWVVWDMLPTIADAGGLPEPEWSDGISIFPTLEGRPDKQNEREYLYWEFFSWTHNFRPQQAVRMGKWKAYRIDGLEGEMELYDLAADPGEKNNLAGLHPEMVKKMEGIMQKEHVQHSHPDVRIPGLD